MFRFRLDGSSGVPPYLQIVHQVRQSLLLGYLQEGDRLPTVKEVAGDLAINPNTVVKAYRQLEHEGLAGGRPGQGTFITAPLAPPPPAASESLRSSLAEWFRSAQEAGLSEEAVTASRRRGRTGWAGSGLTVVIASHVISELERLYDWLLVLTAARHGARSLRGRMPRRQPGLRAAGHRPPGRFRAQHHARRRRPRGHVPACQPVWTLQFIQGGLFLVIAAAALGAAVWLLRRRTT